MGNERAEELIRKYLEGTATPEEEALLEAWYIAAAQDQPDMPAVPDYPKIEAEIWQPLQAAQADQAGRAAQADQQEEIQPKIGIPVRLWPRIAAAASILAILAIGSLFIFRKKSTQTVVESRPQSNDILPAGTRATLTLLDGKAIPLDSSASQTLARQGNSMVSLVNGQLTYSGNPSHSPAKQGATVGYNTLTTQPGEHYSVLLPDGTRVWLNAASSITYPVSFNGNERKVKVTGELYFEIAHDAKQPFRVAVKDQLVEDIGTHLNIKAYDDEPVVNTTLVEGSVKVMKGSASVMLAPGQQAVLGPNDSKFQIKKIEPEDAIAWKNGFFYFDRVDIRTVMREIARWYDVQVVYKGEIPKKTFKGKLYRNINASEALRILSYFGAHFQIDGKTITVSSL